jgi:crotonobetainyl-CoA:carnitine CoA-transferase CaiB-like acyl-CoA transferase
MEGRRLGVRMDPPRLGQHSRELLSGAGYADAEVDALLAKSVVA